MPWFFVSYLQISDNEYMKKQPRHIHITNFPTFEVIYGKYLINTEYITDAYGSNFIT
jgi:hypothetical protein